MATLEHLASVGKLMRHEPSLEHDEFPDRVVYLSAEVNAWISNTLCSAKRDRARDLTPYEQVEQFLYDFAIGRPLVYDVQRKKLDPVARHVWELKTEDVRLIGWFPERKKFVVVCGRLKRELRQAKLYTPCVNQVVWFRENLDVDEPKAITGVSYDDVL